MKTTAGVYLQFEQSSRRIGDNLILILNRDITECKRIELALKRVNEKLQRLTTIDGITGM